MEYKMKPEEELAEIMDVFRDFFTRHHFTLKSAHRQEMVFENSYSELLFDFDNYGMRWGYMAPPDVVYINKASGKRFAVKALVEKLHQFDFQASFDELWRVKGMGYYETWHRIIAEYLENIISDGTFSWEDNFIKQ